MADVQFDKLQLLGLHVPDSSTEIDPGGNKYQAELPGTYEVGFLLGDQFVALNTFKAGNYMDAIRQAQQSASQTTEAQGSSGQPAQQEQQDTPPAEQQPQG